MVNAPLPSVVLALSLVMSLLPAPGQAADVSLDSALYPLLDRLWAEGMVTGYLPDQLPVSVGEAEDLLRDVSGSEDIRILLEAGALVPRLALEAGDEGFVGANRSGIEVTQGAVAGLKGRAEWGQLSLYGDARVPADGETELTEAYVRVTWGGVRFTAGREDLWWGPGRRGDLLLTNNAEALTMFRVDNYPAFTLPGILGNLGGVRLSFFLSELEEARPAGAVPVPIMGGLKISLMPHRNFVLSLNRTFLFGGEGEDEDLGALVDVLLARDGGDGNVIGNQIGGIMGAWRFPSGAQPFVLYGELAGEDEAGYLPTKKGYLAGVYLPRLGRSRLFDVRLEAATTDMPGHRSVWYQHPNYPYVREGRIMGHRAGNDAEDVFFQLGIYPAANSRVSLSAARTRRGVSGTDPDELVSLGLRADWWKRTYLVRLDLYREDWDDLPAGEEEGDRGELSVRVEL